MVECHLAKVKVAGPNPVSRSTKNNSHNGCCFLWSGRDNAPVRFSVSGAQVSANRLKPDEGTLPHYSPHIPFGACFPCQTAAAISNYPVCILYCLTAVFFLWSGRDNAPVRFSVSGAKVSATRLKPDEGTLPHFSPHIPFGACFPCQTAAAISNYLSALFNFLNPTYIFFQRHRVWTTLPFRERMPLCGKYFCNYRIGKFQSEISPYALFCIRGFTICQTTVTGTPSGVSFLFREAFLICFEILF